MLSIDQFESAFRAAAKTPYHPEEVAIERVLVVTDLPPAQARAYADRAIPMLTGDAEFIALAGRDSHDIQVLLENIAQVDPQLIVSYRCLHSPAWRLPYTVGDHIEVLTQSTAIPVLLLPRIDTGHAAREPLVPPQCVMALTDHLVGDDHLVSWAASLAAERLVLAHIEDEAAFQRTMHLIARIPEINTDLARRKLSGLMLDEATDWIASCRRQLSERLAVSEVVQMGGRLSTCRDLITEHGVDLLVLNTKDDEQLAIHGLAWPLMIELRDIPLLLL